MKGLILMLITIVPAVSYASDGDAVVIPWSTIISLTLVIITAVAGGMLSSMRRTLKSSYEALKILSDALEDDQLDDKEIKEIIKATTACHGCWKDLIKDIGDMFKKANKV